MGFKAIHVAPIVMIPSDLPQLPQCTLEGIVERRSTCTKCLSNTSRAIYENFFILGVDLPDETTHATIPVPVVKSTSSAGLKRDRGQASEGGSESAG